MKEHRIEGAVGLDPGTLARLEITDRPICLVRTADGEFFAIDDTCSHEQESLSRGWVEGTRVECAAHNSMFDLRTGEAVQLPATEPLRTYKVEVDGDDVLITVTEE